MTTVGMANVGAAADRFFRFYEAHCIAPNQDTLFNFLEAGHSLNDRLNVGVGGDFLDLPQFVALKCLRNFFHHHQELLNTVRLVPTTGLQISTDLLFLCLIPREAVETAIAQTRERYRSEARDACQETFHWYGPLVNINPCIFNFGVAAFERLNEANVPMTGDAANRLRSSYEMEEEEGHSHFVDGRILTSPAAITQLLAEIAGTEVGV